MKFKDFLDEGPVKDYVNDKLESALRDAGIGFKLVNKMGYTEFSLPNSLSIVNDGVGISIQQNSKEMKYFDRPKLSYNEAIKFVLKEMGVK